MCAYSQLMYSVYAILANIFALYIFTDFYLNIFLDKYIVDDEPVENKYFDHIVVGGGTAGIAVASRLAENNGHNVLLIEAGPKVSWLHDIPLATSMFQKSAIDWQHQTESQINACLAMKNKSSQWPSGRVLGGTSRINFNIHFRGHIGTDYLSWQSGQDWSKEDVLYYFKKYEKADTYIYNRPPNKKQFFSHRPAHVTPIASAVLEAANELGYETSLNMNSDNFQIPRQDGGSFSLTPVTTQTGTRLSAEHLYLKKSKRKKNLIVLTNARVTKILFKNNYEANGVVYNKFGNIFKVYAFKSVVMCAGTLNTPKILMLSGIGPADQLVPLKIPVVVDLSVGKNLQDHIITGMDMITLEKPLGLSFKDIISPINIYKYFSRGMGIWTHPGCEAIGLLRIPTHEKNCTSSPELQFMLLPFGISSDAGAAFFNHMNLKNEFWNEYFQPLVGRQVITLAPVLLHPQSSGYVKLNIKHEIVVQPNYLQSLQDVNVLIRGMKLVKKFVETKALSKFGAMFNTKHFPGCQKYDFGSERYWECYIRHMTLTSYHPVGTCKMGNITETSVVDHSLRVHKLNKLYVIDASIMPSMPSGNTNSVVSMIAEKGADLIKKHCYERSQKCKITDFFYSKKYFNILH